jgi:biopolymer transport protein TolR
MAGVNPRRKPMAEINVVPYIDVMLVLLVIFMITAPLLKTGVEVELPDAQAKSVDSKADETPIIISVDAQGLLYLADDDKPLTTVELQTAVAAALQLAKEQGKNPPVLVAGDEAVDYGAVVRAMAALQAAGVPQVGLLTDNIEAQ